jgi:predicted nucleotidyltransferase
MAELRGVDVAVERIVRALVASLGENLHACILYGSAVRGDLLPRASDLNLLIVLEHSTPDAHRAIADVVRNAPRVVEPFVLGREGLERSRRVFAIKFRSIKRNYRVLHGADVLAQFNASPQLLRFLCEQSLRNLRLRHKHAYITFGDERQRFTRYVLRSLPGIHTALAEALRCEGIEVPKDHAQRLPVLQQAFDTDVAVLHDLRVRKQRGSGDGETMSREQVDNVHERLFRLLDAATRWMEARWPVPAVTP